MRHLLRWFEKIADHNVHGYVGPWRRIFHHGVPGGRAHDERLF
jgi:hypothetical protein